jgi:glycosyltransferase involved in cell wall biosynthesis
MAVLLPAWRPGEELAALVEELAAAGFGAVVVVDDGSGAGYLGVLARVESMARVHVVRHKRRCGKGRALKTGTGYVLGSLEEMEGLITADADGRHSVADVARVAEAFSWTLIGAGGRVVLGVRTFAGGGGWGRGGVG